ncbi:MAG TPA: TonB family protein [Thermomonas sp.]|nr:TonB family protein [Thermomonas sp.]
MARSHALASFRPAGFALLRPASRPRLDSARIITLSGTIAVNTLALGMLMMPLSLPAPIVQVEPDNAPKLIWIKRELPPVVPVEVDRRQPTPPTTQPEHQRTIAQQPTAIASTAVPTDTGTEQAFEDTVVDAGPALDLAPTATGPSPVQLAYLSAPAPTYPRMAKQRGITGTVLLQVLVGIDGRPLEVTVAQSSGSRELDEAARAQVLKRWSFQPASKNGQAVQAIGMVPIQFALR